MDIGVMASCVGRVTRLPPTSDRSLELGRRMTGEVRPHDVGPVVSVITVVYNNAATIQRCIDSVIGQRGVGLEYIVIDGGSTDGTVDIIRANAKHIDYAVSEPDGGIYNAMNKGLQLAQGDFIALINSDDWLEPDGLKLSVDNIRAHEAEVSIGFANVWDRNGKFSHVWKIGNFDARILTSGMSFCHQALIASRHAYDAVGPFDDTIRISADYKWIKKLYLTGLKTVFIEKPVVNFSFDGVAANNRPVWKEECKSLLTEQFSFLAREDVSAFLEYVYRDAPLDQDAVENILMCAGDSPLFLQSVGLVLLDRLFAFELERKQVVSARNRVARRQPIPGLLSIAAIDHRQQKPKISVIIPVYNVEDYLEGCLRSVMTQSLSEIEIICVNDGSPDDCQMILERLAAEDSRIRIISKENGGLSSARNAGLRAATGEYIHFLDSDDHIQPRMYETLYSYARKNRLDLVKSNLGFIDDVYPIKRPILPKAAVFNFSDCPECAQYISPCSALYSKDLLVRVAPFIEGMTYEDRPFNWETLLKADRIGHVDEVFYMYRAGRAGSIMSARKGNMRHFDAFRAVDQIRSVLERSGKLESFLLEYVKEQLRVYSMLIDIDAIPRKAYGAFFWEIHTRLNATAVPLEEILRVNLPPRVKALYAFFLDGVEDTEMRREGERYFFHGLNYLETSKRYAGSSCELFMIAEQAIEDRFGNGPLDAPDVFRKTVLIASLFDHIHSSDIRFVDEMRDALYQLEAVVCDNTDFDQVVSLLHDTPPTKDRARTHHLSFQYSRAPNYQSSCDMLADYFSARGESALILTFDDIELDGVSEPLSAALRTCIRAITEQGIKSYAFSQIVAMRTYLNRALDVEGLHSLTVLFPNSAPERYLIELLKDHCILVSLPHGLPQVSLTTIRPDIVIALTEGSEWQDIFSGARIVHVGWPEAAELPPSHSDKSAKTVLFLSQLEGSGVHKLDDFIDLSNAFLAAALTIDPSLCKFDIRLRKEAELEMFDGDLVAEAKTRSNIFFSTVTSRPMSDLQADLLVSATSTGMLYAQYMDTPSLQIISHRLLQHWPFDLSPVGSRESFKNGNSTLATAIQRRLSDGSVPKLYRAIAADERYTLLDGVYRDLGPKNPDSAREKLAPPPQRAKRPVYHPVSAAFAHLQDQIQSLRTASGVVVTSGHADLGQDVWLSADPAGRAELSCTPGESGWRLTVKAGDSGAWACLGMRLDPGVLRNGRGLGLLMSVTPQRTLRFTPTLRYYLPETILDVPTHAPIVLASGTLAGMQKRVVHIPLDREPLTRARAYELNLFFHDSEAEGLFGMLEPLLVN
jgi:glycosyltransferase involved in cell wall biosynthesis